MKEQLCYAVIYIVEALIVWLYYDSIFAKRRSRAAVLLSYSIVYAVMFSASLFNQSMVNMLSFFLGHVLIAFYNYDCGFKTSVFQSAVLTFAMATTEIAVNLLLTACGYDYAAYTYNLSAMITLSVLSKLLYFVVTIIMAHIFKPHRARRKDPSMILLLCILPLTSLAIAFTVYHANMNAILTEATEILMIFSVIALLIVNIVVLAVYNRIQAIDEEHMQLKLGIMRDEANADYYEMLSSQHENQRILMHDINNHFTAIDALAKNGDLSGVSNYIGEIKALPEFRAKNRMCDNEILNAILIKHQQYCSENNIEFYCDIRAGCLIPFSSFSITTLFGNLVSNAVEAAELSNEKYIELSVRKNDSPDSVIISAANSCDAAPLTDDKGHFITAKGDSENHGYGLKSIERTVKKYNGIMNTNYDISKKQFHILIQFPIEKNKHFKSI